VSHSLVATAIGSVGVALLLAAFLLNLLGVLRNASDAYIVLNLVGAALAAYSSFLIDFLPFVVLEGTWAMVAALALTRRLIRARGDSR
jgi:hypothetical protein